MYSGTRGAMKVLLVLLIINKKPEQNDILVNIISLLQ